MILSMTGYGKAQACCQNETYTLEIKSLNGKNCDVTLKTAALPREKEPLLRQRIAQGLVRGNVDVYLSVEKNAGNQAKSFDKEVATAYLKQITDWQTEMQLPMQDAAALLQTVLRLPEVWEVNKTEMTEEDWLAIAAAADQAIAVLNAFRIREGKTLEADLRSRVDNIRNFLAAVEPHEKERVPAIRERILSRLADLEVNPDANRLEQELIFYLEKLDINEEKVRLAQHCTYFLETMEKEDCPGKKLGFIAQEMGREINTLGSKANHAAIQKLVVMMKDELEKIKEQSLNVL